MTHWGVRPVDANCSNIIESISDRLKSFPMHSFETRDFPRAIALNPRIRESFYAHLGGPAVRRTHFFRGRFENIYLPLELMPEVSNVLIFVKHAAGEVLGHSANDIHVGFWFNLMQPGEVTTRHTHDDDDELLSAVY